MEPRVILLVDDHATTRRLVRRALETVGFVVHEAKDGAAALALMRTKRPALVIQDLVLPDIDGFVLAARLRQLAGSEPVRVLAFSGLVSNLDAKRISSVGFDDVIAKPIEPAHLLALVRSHFAAIDPGDERFGSDRRLLVVDDDPIQLQLTSFRLTRLGFQVEQARDGQHALELARAARPHAIVSDVLMPRLDGFGLATALRRDADLYMVPLILLTSSYLESSDRELAQRSGADDLVLRTPDLAELGLALRTAIARGTSCAARISAPAVELERAHERRMIRQLERQLVHNTALLRRCSLLSAELAIVRALSDAVLAQADVEGALTTALSTCFDASRSSFGALYLLDRHQHLRVRTLGGLQAADGAALASFFGHEVWLRELLRSGRSVLLSDKAVATRVAASDADVGPDEPGAAPTDCADDGGAPASGAPPDVTAEVLGRACCCHAIVVPLVHLGKQLGALFMALREQDQAVEIEHWRLFAEGIANQVTQALALAAAFREREVAEREAEQQRRLAREQAAVFRALVEYAPDVVMQLNPDGRVRFINRLPPGFTPERTRHAMWWELMSPECQGEMQAALELVLKEGTARTLETRGPGAAGATCWLESHVGPIRAGDEIVGALVIQRDVSLKKQSEAPHPTGEGP